MPVIIICEEKGVAKKALCDVTSVKCPICYNAIIFTILHLFGMPHITSHFVKDTSNGCWIIITSLNDPVQSYNLQCYEVISFKVK